MPADRLPDFIIGGAPKCATKSMHFILNRHEDIGLPDSELHFFDSDDPLVHPDFFWVRKGKLVRFDWGGANGALYRHYVASLAPLADRRILGEDSPTYLFSQVAPFRIREMIPDVKLIFMIRDPVERAYSQYWHLVKTFRATVAFEAAISRHAPIVAWSTYAPNLRRYVELFGDRVKVVLFEDFVARTQRTVDEVTAFLGADPREIGDSAPWRNRSRYPWALKPRLLRDVVGRMIETRRYADHLGHRSPPSARPAGAAGSAWKALGDRLVPQRSRPPQMRPETRQYLTRHLAERNRGLSDLLGRDLSLIWPGFTNLPG